jgi:hypothetical protein
VAIRLGVPCYAGDTLTFSGRVVPGADDTGADDTGVDGTGEREAVVEIVGRCSLGEHVTGTVRIVPGGAR